MLANRKASILQPRSSWQNVLLFLKQHKQAIVGTSFVVVKRPSLWALSIASAEIDIFNFFFAKGKHLISMFSPVFKVASLGEQGSFSTLSWSSKNHSCLQKVLHLINNISHPHVSSFQKSNWPIHQGYDKTARRDAALNSDALFLQPATKTPVDI